MVTLGLLASASSAEARGPSIEQLEKAGWDCSLVIAGEPHCFKKELTGQPSATVRVFDASGNFLGTETLLRSDLYAGQPCPQEGLSQWVDLQFGYHACHHYAR
jgi:hypothetical protein